MILVSGEKKYTWAKGETYALKNNSDNVEYNGKYIIIYCTGKKSKNDPTGKIVYMKICESLPNKIDKEFLNNCEYICTKIDWYENRFYPLDYKKSITQIVEERSKKTYYPDENGILYIYETLLAIRPSNKDFLENLIYLGNFELDPPQKEFIPWESVNIHWIFNFELSPKTFSNNIIGQYENNNLKKSKMFDKTYSKEQRKKAKEAFEYNYEIEKKRKMFLELLKSKKNR